MIHLELCYCPMCKEAFFADRSLNKYICDACLAPQERPVLYVNPSDGAIGCNVKGAFAFGKTAKEAYKLAASTLRREIREWADNPFDELLK